MKSTTSPVRTPEGSDAISFVDQASEKERTCLTLDNCNSSHALELPGPHTSLVVGAVQERSCDLSLLTSDQSYNFAGAIATHSPFKQAYDDALKVWNNDSTPSDVCRRQLVRSPSSACLQSNFLPLVCRYLTYSRTEEFQLGHHIGIDSVVTHKTPYLPIVDLHSRLYGLTSIVNRSDGVIPSAPVTVAVNSCTLNRIVAKKLTSDHGAVFLVLREWPPPAYQDVPNLTFMGAYENAQEQRVKEAEHGNSSTCTEYPPSMVWIRGTLFQTLRRPPSSLSHCSLVNISILGPILSPPSCG
jgi:hypothetical protein